MKNSQTHWHRPLAGHADLMLPRGRSLVLERALGERLELRQGLVWLTEPGRPGDVFLRDGQRWTLGSDDPVVITAWQPSWLRFGAREPVPAR